MSKKQWIITGVILFVIVLIVAIPVFKSKQEYKELTQGSQITETAPNEDVYIPSYKDTLIDSVKPSAEPTVEPVPDRVDINNPAQPTEGPVEEATEPTQAPTESVDNTEITQNPENNNPENTENHVSSFEPAEFASVVKGNGIIAASDEEIANAGAYYIGDTILDNAQYVLSYNSKYYDLVYTKKTWDGFLIQDVTLGSAHDSIEEAIKTSGVVPTGVPIYLPLNISGAKTVNEFNVVADSIELIIFDGTNYSSISYAELVQ